MNYKKTVTRAVRLFNKTLGEQIGEKIGGAQITVVVYILILSFIINYCVQNGTHNAVNMENYL